MGDYGGNQVRPANNGMGGGGVVSAEGGRIMSSIGTPVYG